MTTEPSPSTPPTERRRRSSSSSGSGGSGRRRRRRSQVRWRELKRAILIGLALVTLLGAAITWIILEHRSSLPPPAPAQALGLEGPASSVAGHKIASALPAVSCPAEPEKRRGHVALAAACADSQELRALLARGEPTDASDPRPTFAGRTALHHVAQLGDSRSVDALLAAGADSNKGDAQGNTPLHLVATNPHLSHPEFIARRLLEGGARIDPRNARGRTPLQELEADHDRLMAQQNLAKVLYQRERNAMLKEWLGPPPPEEPTSGKAESPAQEEAIIVQTADGPIRIPVDPPAAGAADE